jgi:uncharacterized protein YlxW (UPF0749 family)
VTAWRWSVLVVGGFAGFAFVAGAVSSGGADLRPDRRTQLADLVSASQDRVAAQSAQVAQLRDEVDAAAASAGPVLTPAQRMSLAQLTRAAGYSTVRGPGLSVTLTDAPLPSGGPPPGYAPDDYVVHQQDVAAVVNALWSARAQAVTVMDQRLISTSAVRCVGNTLILQGRVYSPPYVIAAVGQPEQLQAALDSSAQVRDYQRRADLVGLGFRADAQRVVVAPAYDGSVELQHAAVPAAPGEVR